MIDNALTTTQRRPFELVPADATGNRRSRLEEFQRWLDDTGRDWTTPDLAEYQQWLLTRDETRTVGAYTRDTGDHHIGDPITRHYGPVADGSIATYTATIRGRYRQLLDENDTRDALFAMAAQRYPGDPLLGKAWVDEMKIRIENAIKPNGRDVKPITHQDRTDDEVGIRLTRDQADALLASPGLIPIDKLRDTAILAVFLCTGLREQELADLTVSDLRQTVDGELAVAVRQGKGKKARCVPWGAGQWALVYVDKWLDAAGIVAGSIFRGFYKGYHTLRPGKLTTRALQKLVSSYPVMVDGQRVMVHPHDLRRTYARRCYDGGMDILAIQQNLGHADHKTTLGYIGVSDVDSRRPPSLYTPPHWAELDKLKVQGRLDGK